MNEERHSMAANNEMKQMLELSDSYVKAITIKKKKKKTSAIIYKFSWNKLKVNNSANK